MNATTLPGGRSEGTAMDGDSVRLVLKYRWPIFIVLASCYFLAYFHRTSTSVVGVDLMNTFGVDVAAVALLGSAYFFVYMAMQLPAGILADRWGPRRTMTLFLSIAALGTMVTAFATSFAMVMLGRLLISAGVALIYIPAMKVIAMWFRTDEFASLSGLMLAIGNVGAIAAATPLAMMTSTFGWEDTYLILGLFTLTLPVFVWAIVVDRPTDKGLPSIQEIERSEGGRKVLGPAIESITVLGGARMAFNGGRKFWPLALWFFITYGALMMYQGLQAGPYYLHVYGWENFSHMIVLVGVGLIVGSPIAGYLSDKVLRSRRQVLIIGTFGLAVVWAFIWHNAGQFPDPLHQGAVNFAMGFFSGCFVVVFAQVKEMFPLTVVGTVTASLNIFPFLGGAVYQVISGRILAEGPSLAGYQDLWLLTFVSMVAALLCAYFSVERTRHFPPSLELAPPEDAAE